MRLHWRKWARIRRRVFDAHNWRCQTPGCDRLAEELHHVVPVAEGGGHGDENLIPLCKGHHLARHDRLAGQPKAQRWRSLVRERVRNNPL